MPLCARSIALILALAATAGTVGAVQSPPVSPELERAREAMREGNDLRRAGKYDEADAAYIIARDLGERIGDQRVVANALINISSLRGQQGDYAIALSALDRALALGDALHDDDIVAAVLTNQAIIYRLTGDYDRAIETNNRSLQMAITANDRSRQGRVSSNIGNIYLAQGHYRKALEYLERAVVLKREADPSDVGVALNSIGMLHAQQGNVDLALDYFTRALAESQASPNAAFEAATGLRNIGAMYREKGDLDRAEEFFRRSLESSERLGLRREIASMRYNLASLERMRGHLPQALDGFRGSFELSESISDKTAMVESLAAMANVLGQMNRAAEGLASAERAVATAREIRSNEGLWQPLKALGDFRQIQGDRAGAEAAYRESIDTIEAIRLEVAGGAQSRQRYFQDKLGAYHSLAAMLIEQRRIPEAFAVAERARARVLAEVLEPDAATVRPLTADERQRQQALERDVRGATAQLAAAERNKASAKTTADLQERVRKARLAADEVRDALDARYPVRRVTRASADRDLQAALTGLLTDPREAIVEFAVTDTATDVFVATRAAGARAATLTAFTVHLSRKDLAARVNAFRAKLASRGVDFHDDARALHDLLLRPARAALGARARLVIIPDDVLWTIPFEALEPAANTALIDTTTIAYAPSVVVLRVMHDRQDALGARLVPPRLAVAADPASDLPRLPDAERQATGLAAMYGAGRSRILVGDAATEPRVRSALVDADVLHFATHGIVDDGDPLYSFLQLTRGGASDAAGDGRLEAWEIQSLKLRAAVAVLTACDTARGASGGGEGVIGLAWSFLAAGTPSMVVSLWQLDSASATALTSDLHERLRTSIVGGHARVAESLRAAAQKLRSDPRYRHPYYWAGLVAIGDGY